MEKMYYLVQTSMYCYDEEGGCSMVIMESQDISTLRAHLHKLYEEYLKDEYNEILNGIYNPNNEWSAEFYTEQCWKADEDLYEDWDENLDSPRSSLWPPAERKNNLTTRNDIYQIIPDDE